MTWDLNMRTKKGKTKVDKCRALIEQNALPVGLWWVWPCPQELKTIVAEYLKDHNIEECKLACITFVKKSGMYRAGPCRSVPRRHPC